MSTFIVNGIEYIEKEKKESSSSKSSVMKNILPYMMLNDMAMGGYEGDIIKEPERPKVNIIEEYGKIQLKKSNLSSRQRQWVVKQFESKYQILK
jgi:hypothetical protein